jgi:hypothetical protein
MAAAAANNVRVFFMPLLDIVGRNGMASPGRHGRIVPLASMALQHPARRQNADDIKNLAVRNFGYRRIHGAIRNGEYGNVWPRRKKESSAN